mmetsp:Transcript_51327/g.159104  ORF Transcript_51327/g.159104 Transcript_51327/m.159104 type:complete len:231 (+) Transcript_51327:251-943(+)
MPPAKAWDCGQRHPSVVLVQLFARPVVLQHLVDVGKGRVGPLEPELPAVHRHVWEELGRKHEVHVGHVHVLLEWRHDGHVGVQEHDLRDPRPLQHLPDHLPLQPNELRVVARLVVGGGVESLAPANALLRVRQCGLAQFVGQVVHAEDCQVLGVVRVVEERAQARLQDRPMELVHDCHLHEVERRRVWRRGRRDRGSPGGRHGGGGRLRDLLEGVCMRGFKPMRLQQAGF